MKDSEVYEKLDGIVKKYQDELKVKVEDLQKDYDLKNEKNEQKINEVNALLEKLQSAEDDRATFQEKLQEDLDEMKGTVKQLKMFGGVNDTQGFITHLSKALNDDSFKSWSKDFKSGKKDFVLNLKDMSPKDIYKIKAITMTTGASLTETEGDVIAPDYQPSIIRPILRTTPIRSLFNQGTTGSNAINYVQEKSVSGCPDYTAESSLKHKFSFTFEAKQEAVRKIAGFMKITEEMLEDIPALQSYLVSRANEEYRYVEDDRLLRGTGSGGDHPGASGVIPTAQTIASNPWGQVIDNPNMFSALRAASATLMGPGTLFSGGDARNTIIPDAIVLHPLDFLLLKEQKGTDAHYLDRGQAVFTDRDRLMTDGMGNMFFDGIPIFLSTAMTQGKFLVGNFSLGGQLFDRKGVTIRFYDQNEDDPIYNRITIVIEARLALVKYRPQAWVYDDFSDVQNTVLAST